jgi:hypothetical protein
MSHYHSCEFVDTRENYKNLSVVKQYFIFNEIMIIKSLTDPLFWKEYLDKIVFNTENNKERLGELGLFCTNMQEQNISSREKWVETIIFLTDTELKKISENICTGRKTAASKKNSNS